MSSCSLHWESLKVNKLAGESQVSHRAVFTNDSKYLLVPCGSYVKVYARETGCIVNILSHHNDTVTHIALGQAMSMKVYTSSLDGHIAVWDYTDGSLLKFLNIGQPILYFCLTNKNTLFYVTKDDHNSKYNVVSVPNIFHAKKSIKRILNESTTLLTFDTPIKMIHLTFDESHLVTFSHKTLYIYAIDNDHSISFSMSNPITTCYCHPSQHCIATGDRIGQIFLWYNYCKGEESLVTTTKLHWHAHAVSDLCFSTDGTNLLSGGEEGVLVVWTLATSTKHFRPRLGSPIMGVACCQGDHTFAVSLANNAILLISGFNSEILHILVSIYRSLPGMSYTQKLNTGLVYDPHSKSLVFNGLPGKLQFIDVEKLRLRQQLEVVPLNYFSRTDTQSITPTTVDWAGFSPEGVWLATVESWDSKELSPECKLKFWKFDTTKQRYVLNTSVDPPHDGNVTSLIFRPTYLTQDENESNENRNESYCEEEFDSDDLYLSLAVTTGLDGNFKIWGPDTSDNMIAWDCLSVGQYYNLPCHGAVFSEDGSILAVNFGKYITLWKNPLSLELIHVINSPIANDQFCHVCFGHSDSSHYLFLSSYHHLHLWNLLTFNNELIIPASVDVLVSDPYSNNVAVFTSKTTTSSTTVDLMIVSPLYSKPLATYKNISSTPIQSALFLPVYNENGLITSQLYFMNKSQLLYSIVSSDTSDEERSPFSFLISENLKKGDKIDTNRIRFNELFGQNKQSSVISPQNTVQINGDRNVLVSPLSLPPMSVYCKTYLTSLLPKISTNTTISHYQACGSIDEKQQEKEEESSQDEEDTDNHQLDVDAVKMDVTVYNENEEVDNRKLDVFVGKFDWLTEFFRTIV